MARTAWRPARGKDDRHGQSGLHLGKPLSPGRGRGDRSHPGRDLGGREGACGRLPFCARTVPDPAHDDGRRVRAQAHLYLPAIFPDFYGRPIFGNEGALVAAPICQAITSLQPCPEKFEIRKFALRCAQIPKL